MRLLDNNRDKKLDDITLLLTHSEAKELRDSIDELLCNIKKNTHAHINNEDYTKEITIAIYDEEKIGLFSNRCKKLIICDE